MGTTAIRAGYFSLSVARQASRCACPDPLARSRWERDQPSLHTPVNGGRTGRGARFIHACRRPDASKEEVAPWTSSPCQRLPAGAGSAAELRSGFPGFTLPVAPGVSPGRWLQAIPYALARRRGRGHPHGCPQPLREGCTSCLLPRREIAVWASVAGNYCCNWAFLKYLLRNDPLGSAPAAQQCRRPGTLSRRRPLSCPGATPANSHRV